MNQNATHIDRLLTIDQVKQACPIVADKCDRTLARWEARGKFPKRRKITRSTSAWSERELADFSRDPEAWQRRNAEDHSEASDNAAA